MGITKRFLKTFSIALIIGILYVSIVGVINEICIRSDIHLYMSADAAERLLIELMGYIVIIYGFFAAFLIYTINDIPKFSDEEYNGYKKVISEKMNIFVWITGFVVVFLFNAISSIYWLESLRYEECITNNLPIFNDLPAGAAGYLFFFMIIISLLGYLVYSLVMGMLQVRAEKRKMPIATIEGPKIRDVETKRKLVKEITDALEKTYKIPREAYVVVIKENSPENVGVGGKLIIDKDK